MEGPVILALGGSLLRPEMAERHQWLEKVRDVIANHVANGGRIGLVIGGGAPAREAIDLAKPIIDDVAALDEIGIAATRLNATVVAQMLESSGIDVCPGIPSDTNAAARALNAHSVVVMGGTRPGHTTDNVAIRLAIESNATRCLIATNVSKVHDKDPRKHSDARPIDLMTLQELQDIVGPPIHGAAGTSAVIDPIGVQAAIDHSLALAVLDGGQVDRLAAALAGESFEGTIIEVSE
ncbi:MAG: UMP kinase [Candidatus Thermoplasmatota archaeon]|nr:UMP kinase [Candidatus Thermoplasmatota archaeon]